MRALRSAGTLLDLDAADGLEEKDGVVRETVKGSPKRSSLSAVAAGRSLKFGKMSSPSKPKRQRVDLTWAEKKTICEVHKEKPSFSHLELAKYMVEHHGFRLVNRSTISRTLEESSRWLEVSPNVREGKTKRVRDAKWPQVDKAIMLWFGQIRARRGAITDAMLVEKATEFRDVFGISRDDFKLSHGWLEKFKSRHGILCHNNHLHDESGDADAHGAGVPHAKLLAIIEKYDPEDVFNFDETGLYYRAPPSESLNVGQLRGTAKETDCVTLGLCANIPGKDRLKMIFIHKSARPRCFPTAFDPNLFVHYYSNRNAWMNGDVFTTWVAGENQRMAAKGRKILILLDNAASHNVEGLRKTRIGDFDAFVLSNITLLFFPANVTSIVHPLHHGVIAALKLRYRSKLVAWSLAQSGDSNNVQDWGVDLLQCMVWVVGTWNNLDAETIQNAWRASGILPQDWNADVMNSQEQVKSRIMDDEVAELERLIQAVDIGGDLAVQKLAASEYINMVDEDDIEAEYSTQQIVDLVENGQMSLDSLTEKDDCNQDEIDGSTDKNDTERRAIELVVARGCGQKLLDFMLNQGSFECSELLQVERICDKISRECLAHVTAAAEQSHVKSSELGE